MMRVSEIRARTGQKRFVALVILFMLTAGLGGAWQEWFLPQSIKLTAEKNSAESERARLQQEIIDLPAKYEQLKKNEARYEGFLAHGYTKTQDRIAARQRLDELRNESGIRGIDYNIDAQEILKSDESYAVTDDMVRSGINVSFKALTDVEIRDFVDKMQNEFDGLVVLKNLDLERKEPLTQDNLAKLSMKTPVDFIEGKASFDWYSLVPKATDANAATNQAFGGTSK
jgi:hypothetical protein